MARAAVPGPPTRFLLPEALGRAGKTTAMSGLAWPLPMAWRRANYDSPRATATVSAFSPPTPLSISCEGSCAPVVLALAFLASPLFSQQILLLRNVHVVDVAAGKVTRSQCILIRGNRIAEIAPQIAPPAGAHAIEGAGEYVIPGLWDMHVHLWYKEHQFPLYLAQGITGVRDMGSDLERVKVWRREIAAGRLLGPHIETSGPMLDGAPSQDPKLPVIVVRTPAEAVATYNQLEARRVDFIKVGSGLPREAYFALLDAPVNGASRW